MEKQTKAYLGAFLSLIFPGLGLFFAKYPNTRNKGIMLYLILVVLDIAIVLVSLPLMLIGIGFLTILIPGILSLWASYYTYQKIMNETYSSELGA
jgi:uncharacterized membrane protein